MAAVNCILSDGLKGNLTFCHGSDRWSARFVVPEEPQGSGTAPVMALGLG